MKLSQVSDSALLDRILKLVVIRVACAHFPTQFLPSKTFYLICFDTALLEQPPFSVMTLFVEGVNDRLLDHCQVSSVPHYCGFKEQEIYTQHLYCMNGHLMKLKCKDSNILRYWILLS